MVGNILMDGQPLKVGDEVYSLYYGHGEVAVIDKGQYPVFVIFNDDTHVSFTRDFKLNANDLTRNLYWQRPEIIPPPKPRKKVKVWDWFIQGTNLQCWILYGVSEVPKDVLIQITQKIDGTEREIEV